MLECEYWEVWFIEVYGEISYDSLFVYFFYLWIDYFLFLENFNMS